ncbi:unnamed protein product [Parascedosporium putredinis]|uniref:SMP-LTD domain-containing protein n=1 Tax=Parascedosporium putredinis TaxID=1442378 RepID=A0A9P1H7R5_9PEZI|nr:unnamed protein product [Parascedosporium putredinis]CAI8001462.1 unnamed protein product [Parascedosporium putredinis]
MLPNVPAESPASRRLADLEDRARAEPKHQLVRVQGTIVLSRCELAPKVRAEMEAIVAPTEILFVTWRERLNKVDVNLKRGAGGILRVEMAQGSPTGIPLIRNRVEFRIQRKDAKTVIEPATEEMVGNTMVWHLPGNAAVPKGEALCVEVVSNGQILAQIDSGLDRVRNEQYDTNDVEGWQAGDDVAALKEAQDAKKEGAKSRLTTEPDVAAGYFAVCREYTPMGINAKPIERQTPVGSATVAAPSQSVYQTMYKSIFDRKQTASPLDAGGAGSQRPKRAGNVFYVALRHGHLMLFDDEEQLEVRHVISLTHYDISIYSGGDVTPEGELYIKRNAICLSKKSDIPDLSATDALSSKPFYLFSENCSAKEDFYLALLRNKEQSLGPDSAEAPVPLQYEVGDVISLVQRLHSTEDHMQTRWLNAFIGRIFLSLYKTCELENIIREKLTKKISRVKRPSFLSHIVIRDIHTGNSAPFISNPKLRELNVDGECVVEADIKYTGNFRIEVTTTARIDLGTRFKAREVDLTLAVVLRKIEGRALFKIKAPPSNRFWFSFQTMPKMEMHVEPVVSSRQITQKWRGGIWATDNESRSPPSEHVIDAPTISDEHGHNVQYALDMSDPKHPTMIEKEDSDSLLSAKSPTASLFSRKLNIMSGAGSPRASTTSFESPQHSPAVAHAWPAPSRAPVDVAAPSEVTKTEHAVGIREMPSSSAIQTLSAIASSPKPESPLASPIKPPPPVAKAHSGTSIHDDPERGDPKITPARSGSISRGFFRREDTGATLGSATSSSASTHTNGSTVKTNTLAAVSNAALQARQWGLNALQRHRDAKNEQQKQNHHTNHGDGHSSHVDLSQPMEDQHQPVSESVLVVAAPSDSEPGTPAGEVFPPLETATKQGKSAPAVEQKTERTQEHSGPSSLATETAVADDGGDISSGESSPRSHPSSLLPTAEEGDTPRLQQDEDDGYSGWMDDNLKFEDEAVDNNATVIAETNLF